MLKVLKVMLARRVFKEPQVLKALQDHKVLLALQAAKDRKGSKGFKAQQVLRVLRVLRVLKVPLLFGQPHKLLQLKAQA